MLLPARAVWLLYILLSFQCFTPFSTNMVFSAGVVSSILLVKTRNSILASVAESGGK